MRSKSEKSSAIVYGASGHGKVVAEILRACHIEVEGFVDDNPGRAPADSSLKMLGDGEWLAREALQRPIDVALGIGDNADRYAVAERIASQEIGLLTAIHPTAAISPSANIGAGVVIMPNAVVNADALLEQGAIVNTGAIVEHDCMVGRYAHLSPKVAIGGNVEIGPLSWLGIGCSVIPNLKIGRGVTIGAGSTVIHDIDDWVVAVGTPARILRKLQQPV